MEGSKGTGRSEAASGPDAVTSGDRSFREVIARAGASARRYGHRLAARHILGDQIGVRDGYLGGGKGKVRLPAAAWFDRLPDLSTRTFGIALAALDGLPYADVALAATRLYHHLDQTQKVALVPTVLDPTQPSNRNMLRSLRASPTPGEVRLAVGRVPADVVSYRRATMAHQVLEHAWHGYQIHDALLCWLCELVDEPAEHVRLFAGTALGVLATMSFDQVWNQALDSLARDDRAHRREAAAISLSAAAADERLRPVVRSLVGRWFGGADRAAEATAARVHGLVLGQRSLPSTLDALGRLATVGSIRVAVAIGEALADLVTVDPQAALSTVYPALLSWMEDYRRAPTAHLAFLVVAVDTVIDGHTGGASDQRCGSPPTVWPALLHLATLYPDLRQPLCTTWHRVLDESALFDEAERALSVWAGRAEGSDQILDAFARMVRAVASLGSRTRTSLRHIVDDWVDPYRLSPLPKAAAAVAAALGPRGTS